MQTVIQTTGLWSKAHAAPKEGAAGYPALKLTARGLFVFALLLGGSRLFLGPGTTDPVGTASTATIANAVFDPPTVVATHTDTDTGAAEPRTTGPDGTGEILGGAVETGSPAITAKQRIVKAGKRANDRAAGLEQPVEDAIDGAKQVGEQNVVDSMRATAGDAKDAVVSKVGRAAKGAADKADEARAGIKRRVHELEDVVIEEAVAVEHAAQAGIDMAKNKIRSAEEAVEGVVNSAKQMATETLEVARDKASELEEAVEGAVDAAKEVVGDAVATAKDKAGELEEAVEGAVDAAKEVVGDAVATAKDTAAPSLNVLPKGNITGTRNVGLCLPDDPLLLEAQKAMPNTVAVSKKEHRAMLRRPATPFTGEDPFREALTDLFEKVC